MHDVDRSTAEQLAALSTRVAHLESEVARLRTAAMQNETPARSIEAAIGPEGVPAQSFENRVGSQWFNRIGIVALLVGAAWFLKFAFDNAWVGPAGRFAIGLAAGLAMFAWSERFRRRHYDGFSYSLKAVGSGVLYLSLWAGYSISHLTGAGVTFALMVLVTVGNAAVAWAQNSELLAVYAIVGAFGTPILLPSSYNDEVFLFSYLAVMTAAMLLLLIGRGWDRLLPLSFAGTAISYCAWYWQHYGQADFAATLGFLLLYFLLFSAAVLWIRTDARLDAQEGLSRSLVTVGNAALGFFGVLAMLHFGSHQAESICALAFGLFYLGASWFLRHKGAGVLANVQLGCSVTLFAIAIGFAVHTHWITVGWMLEGAVLLAIGFQRRSTVLRCMALGLLAVTILKVFLVDTSRLGQGYRIISFLALGVLLLVVSFAYQRDWLRLRATESTPNG